MKHYRVRFNKSRGNPGRGTPEHVWRVFDDTGKEWLCKHVQFFCNSYSEKDGNSEDWNIACDAFMVIDKVTSTIKFVDNEI